MLQQVGQGLHPIELDCQIFTGTPSWESVVELVRLGHYLVAEGLEEASQNRLAALRRQHGQSRSQGNRGRGKFGTILARSRHRRTEDLEQRCAHERRGDVGSVVHVLAQAGAATGSGQRDGVDVDEQSHSAALFCSFGIEDVCLSDR